MTSRYISCTPKKSGMKALHRFFRLWIWSSHDKIFGWFGWQPSLGIGPMGELDLELGGRQKTQRTPARNRENRNHNFLTTMKAKKMKSTAVLFKLGYSYSAVLCLLSCWRRFFHWIESPNWSFNSVIWQNPRLKFVFRMRYALEICSFKLCNSCHLPSIWAKPKGFAGDCAWKHSGLECLHCKRAPTNYPVSYTHLTLPTILRV